MNRTNFIALMTDKKIHYHFALTTFLDFYFTIFFVFFVLIGWSYVVGFASYCSGAFDFFAYFLFFLFSAFDAC